MKQIKQEIIWQIVLVLSLLLIYSYIQINIFIGRHRDLNLGARVITIDYGFFVVYFVVHKS